MKMVVTEVTEVEGVSDQTIQNLASHVEAVASLKNKTLIPPAAENVAY